MKEYVDRIESIAAQWYETLPQPPRAFRRWLYENVWWIIVISVVLGVFGVLSTLKDASIHGYNLSFSLHSVFSTMDRAAITITLAISVVILIINASAISPLRRKYKVGWNLLLASLILSAASVVIGVVLTFDVGSFISGAFMTLVLGYLLFAFRDEYVVHSIKSSTKKSTKK